MGSNFSMDNQQLKKKPQKNKISKKKKIFPQQQSCRPVFQQTQNHKYLEKQLQINTSHTKKPAPQHFVCSICQQSFPKQSSVQMCKCQHVFCQKCLNDHVLIQLKNIKEIICPQQFCNSLLDEKSPFYLSLSKQIKEKYEKNKLNYAILKDSTLRYCPTQNCPGTLKITDLKFCICNICQKWLCKYCLLLQHQGKCEQHQVNHLQNILRYRKCSNCKIIVQKTQGCDHITCKCKHQFCYKCGQTWISGHKCQQKNNQSNSRLITRDQNISTAQLHRQNQTQRINLHHPPRRSCQKNIQTFLCNWLVYIPFLIVILLLIIAVFLPCFVFCGLIVGIFVGPVELFIQICDQNSCFIKFITIIFFPIPIVIGIIKGIIKWEIFFLKQVLGDLIAPFSPNIKYYVLDSCNLNYIQEE